MLPLQTNLRDAYQRGTDDEQNFIQNLSLFLCTYLKEHASLVEKKKEQQQSFLEALYYLILISEVDDVEIFKICLEEWNTLAADLYRESPFPTTTSPLLLGKPHHNEVPARRQLYIPVLSKVPNLLSFCHTC